MKSGVEMVFKQYCTEILVFECKYCHCPYRYLVLEKVTFWALTDFRVNGEYESSFALHNYFFSTFSVPPSSPFVSTSFLV